MSTWSPQQDAALTAVDAWLNDAGAPQVFRLFGYAGTGKTTLARHLAEGVEGDVVFGAFTGKAALVMQRKGCRGARTIHSLIYSVDEEAVARAPTHKAQGSQWDNVMVFDESSTFREHSGRWLYTAVTRAPRK